MKVDFIMLAKKLIKSILYYSKILSLYHLVRNKNVLTVVVFHRVLNTSDARWLQANKEWTVTSDFFKEIITYFNRHYNIVTLDDVIECNENNVVLPHYPLLITFDDGWKDNYEFAYPITKEVGVPITVFCTTGAINSTYLNWREIVYALITLSSDNATHLLTVLSRYNLNCGPEATAYDYIQIISSIDDNTKIISDIDALVYLLGSKNQMLSDSDITDMYESELVSFGTHGHSHEPLKSLSNPENELKLSRDILSNILHMNITSLAYPHSSVTKEIYSIAAKEGYKYQFGGRNSLNKLSKTRAINYFGRIAINQLDLCDNNGRLLPELLSLLLFRTKHQKTGYSNNE